MTQIKPCRDSLYLPPVGSVIGPKTCLQALLVKQHTAMKPHGAISQQNESEPGPEGEREADHENEMAKVHRVSCVAARPCRDDLLWNHLHAPAPAGTRLQMLPQAQAPWITSRPSANGLSCGRSK